MSVTVLLVSDLESERTLTRRKRERERGRAEENEEMVDMQRGEPLRYM